MTQSTTPKPYDKKKKLVQLIHIGKSKLCLDDGTYRSLLETTTGKTSTKEMTLGELNKVMTRFKQLGFTPTAPKSAKKSSQLRQADDPQSKLIRHLWLSLHSLGAVNDPSEKALCAYIKRQTGVDLLIWLKSAKKSQVIESLKKWVERVEKQADKTESTTTINGNLTGVIAGKNATVVQINIKQS